MEASLKEYLNSKPNAKTCIIDNNFLDFCTRLKEKDVSILAHILSYYFPKLASITLLTFDKDCYNCIYYAQYEFNKNDNFKNRDYASITFKSNDFVLYELVKNKYYTMDYIKEIINNIRTPRNIKFSRRKEDNSFEEKFYNVDNSTLIDIICDDSVHIVF